MTKQAIALIQAVNKADKTKLVQALKPVSDIRARKNRRRRAPITGARKKDVLDVIELLRQTKVEASLFTILDISPPMREEIRVLDQAGSQDGTVGSACQVPRATGFPRLFMLCLCRN
ncbi:hypothetical protein GGTG_02235 [Gaeumannomyces tritici R3-111a-1]|uniref:Uncharacterized protein n=1 Tax=Gaeumannomyces tritici (strain R3-111a-1) TaxID=644352 RepID=J3NLT5_GAET3|nr:hypothetical protein GGTG_02235 [Gaeumannomyces tritici R3-111a-1]EJT82261.1 hypothetical protein GGTG_02235 [Gaeumannomyces tritici R3-111a-1]